jgi:hypothetical protein
VALTGQLSRANRRQTNRIPEWRTRLRETSSQGNSYEGDECKEDETGLDVTKREIKRIKSRRTAKQNNEIRKRAQKDQVLKSQRPLVNG